MKIIAWNCNMAFRKKGHHILAYKPNILVVPECENPSLYPSSEIMLQAKETFWVGDNKSKGLAVFSYSDFRIKVFPNYNKKFRYILPLQIEGPLDFNLFAVWNMNNKEDYSQRYIGQLWLALHYYRSSLVKPTIICGDLNSNKIWDKVGPRKIASHSQVVEFLSHYGITSLYHKYFKEEQGQESIPTQYMYRKEDKPYHLDYCFTSQEFLKNLKEFEIGKFLDWSFLSDHMPVIATFKESLLASHKKNLCKYNF